jgi:hypothetical protein
MISPGIKWLIALMLVVAFASGEVIGFNGANASHSPQENASD